MYSIEMLVAVQDIGKDAEAIEREVSLLQDCLSGKL